MAALINPRGDDRDETVTLLNTTPRAIVLDRWRIADQRKRRTALDGTVLPPGEAVAVSLAAGEARLSNKGGIISLINPEGRKVDGVSYTKGQASRQGWTVVF